MGEARIVIKKGSLVRRRQSDFCIHLRRDIFHNDYPPEGEACIVVSSPKEKDLTYQLRRVRPDYIALKKSIDVIYGGTLFGPCDIGLFEEVKNEQPDGG